MAGLDLKESQMGDSTSAESEPEEVEGSSVSQAQRVLVRSLRWFELILGYLQLNPHW